MIAVPFSSLDIRDRRSVFTIGVFDGVHLGHRAILRTLMEMKEALGAETAAAITFSVNPKCRNGQIDTMRLRAEAIGNEGVDVLAVIDFSPDFSKISACGFMDLLLKSMTPAGAAVGSDFRFGNPSSEKGCRDLGPMLMAKGCDCSVSIVDSVLDPSGERISSTRIREMISEGRLGGIPALAGQFYRVDLVPLPYGSCSGELIFSRALIHQLLPPLGTYDARLLSASGKSAGCTAAIDGEYLRLRLPSSSLSMLRGGNGKEELLLDSLYLEKKR